MKYKLVIFDMDGTILNTLNDLADSVNYILKMYNMKPRSEKEIRSYLGNGLLKTLRCAVSEGTDEKLIAEMFPKLEAYYKEHSNEKTKPYPEIVNIINKLKETGYLTAVASNKREAAVYSLCKEHFTGCFNYMVGDLDGRKLKPDSEMVEIILKELGVSKEEAVYIGDSEVDMKTAANSGLDCILVTWGFRDREQLENTGAKCIIDEPVEILNLV